ncbi:MAG: deoxyribose-phosphate aldolase [Anaerolineae bacterium]|nr:deoxyribose-phosphate aldolase [Anaerolineae bacterium]
MLLTPVPLVHRLELALLAPQLSRAEVEAGCALAHQYDCVSVFVKPHYIEVARKTLKDTRIAVVSVVGFPNGGVTTATKMYETQDLIQRGADELAMVLNIGALRDGDDLAVRNDIAGVVKTARGKPVTVILETSLLSEEEKARACQIIQSAPIAYVMTATGFAPQATTVADVQRLRALCPSVKIRAAGGIETQATAIEMIGAGAARVVVNDVVRVLST